MDKYENNYAPKGKFLWDMWFINKDDVCHMFHLQSDPTENPIDRHRNNVSIGHATTRDFINWHEEETVLVPSKLDDWDNKDLWSGSIAEKDGTYYLYYTGKNNQSGNENIQKICVATSKDLFTWGRHNQNPILSVDERYYYMDNKQNALGNFGAWRDPFVFKDINSEKRYMTISARDKSKNKREYDACVALAESDDMINWQVLPPIFSPGVYDEIEVTHMIHHNGYYYLFFTMHASSCMPEFAKEHSIGGGLHCYYSDNLFGGYKPVNGNGMVLDNWSEIYDIRILFESGNDFTGLGWLNMDKEGNFIGKVANPIKIRIEGDRIYKI